MKILGYIFLLLLLMILLNGCQGTPGAVGVGWPIPALVPIINVVDVPKDQLQAARQIKIYTADNNNYPEIEKSLGKIEGYSVKHLLWEPSPTEEQALIQIRLRALKLGANGIINVSFSRGGLAEALMRDSWESIKVTGTAVRFKQ